MRLDRRLFLAGATAAAAPGAASAEADPAATLQAQIQALCDAVTAGDASVWARYLHDNAAYTSEDGDVFTKAQMVAQIHPLPANVSGVLALTDVETRRVGDVAIVTYVIDEHETYHGGQLHCQYRNTDTWIATPDGWRLLALQSLALRTDPPDIALSPADLAAYAGTYRLSADTAFVVARVGDGLTGQQTGGPARPLKAEVRDVLFQPGRPRYRFIFMRDAQGRVDRMIERREAWDLVWMRA
ncbi:MAG TPA: DUF4440 domain-containing protein [Caulobacterales bacterium]|nr:DUF4440 domain-containing protein [Caulobacterales bacterium]